MVLLFFINKLLVLNKLVWQPPSVLLCLNQKSSKQAWFSGLGSSIGFPESGYSSKY